jgi:WD40 repeat protein
LAGHAGAVMTMAMTPNGDRAVSLSYDRTLRLWDLYSGRALRVLVGHRSELNQEYLRSRAIELEETVALQIDTTDLLIARGARLAISNDGTRAIFADAGVLGIWHLDSGRVVSTTLEDFEAEEVDIDGDVAIAGSILGTLCLLDPAEAQVVRYLDAGRGLARNRQIMDIVIDAGRRRAMTASRDGSIKSWDLATGKEDLLLRGDGEKVDAIAIAPNGRFAYVVSGDTVRASDLMNADRSSRLSLDHNITAVAVTPDGFHAAVGDESGRVHFLELDAS